MSTTQTSESSAQGILWIGIDVSNASFDAALYPPIVDGQAWELRQIQVRSFGMDEQGATELLKWARAYRSTPGEIRVGMEASGKCSLRLAALLLEISPDVKVSIINPLFVKRFGQSLGVRNKTDRLDARVISRFAAERQPHAWQPPSQVTELLREMSRQRQSIVEAITEHNNRLAECESKLTRQVQSSVIKCLEKQCAKLDRAIAELVAGDSQLRADVALLDSVMGVGQVTAVTVVAELGDLRDFARAVSLSAFTGLSPRRHTSGTSVNGRTVMCKVGNDRIRRVMYMASLSTLRTENRFSKCYHRLRQRGKSHRQALGAVMRKQLLVMRAVLKSNQPYQDAHLPCGKKSAKGETALNAA